MSDDIHPVVELLVARMESHPEEFGNDPADDYIERTECDRWWQARTLVMEYGSDEDKAVLRAAMRDMKLKVAHEWMLDELLNGPERRAEEQRKLEEDRKRYATMQANVTQALQQSTYASNLNQALQSTQQAVSADLLQNMFDSQMVKTQYDYANDALKITAVDGTGVTLPRDVIEDNNGLFNTIKKGLRIK